MKSCSVTPVFARRWCRKPCTRYGLRIYIFLLNALAIGVGTVIDSTTAHRSCEILAVGVRSHLLSRVYENIDQSSTCTPRIRMLRSRRYSTCAAAAVNPCAASTCSFHTRTRGRTCNARCPIQNVVIDHPCRRRMRSNACSSNRGVHEKETVHPNMRHLPTCNRNKLFREVAPQTIDHSATCVRGIILGFVPRARVTPCILIHAVSVDADPPRCLRSKKKCTVYPLRSPFPFPLHP